MTWWEGYTDNIHSSLSHWWERLLLEIAIRISIWSNLLRNSLLNLISPGCESLSSFSTSAFQGLYESKADVQGSRGWVQDWSDEGRKGRSVDELHRRYRYRLDWSQGLVFASHEHINSPILSIPSFLGSSMHTWHISQSTAYNVYDPPS